MMLLTYRPKVDGYDLRLEVNYYNYKKSLVLNKKSLGDLFSRSRFVFFLISLLLFWPSLYSVSNALRFLATDNDLPDLFHRLLNTIIIFIMTSTFSFVIGLIAAWSVSFYDFTGKRFISFIMILPAAIPPYLSAFAYGRILDYSGPVQSLGRSIFGDHFSYIFPNPRSLVGASLIMSLSLFPFTYLTLKARFSRIIGTMAVARSCNMSIFQVFKDIVIPISVPSLIASFSLGLIEAVSDLGVARDFGLDTISTGIWNKWFIMQDKNSAIIDSGRLLILTAAILMVINNFKKDSRETRSFSSAKVSPACLLKCSYCPQLFCFIIFMFSFFLPILFFMISGGSYLISGAVTLKFLWNTIKIVFLSALLASFVSLFIAYLKSVNSNKEVNTMGLVSKTNYAMPGIAMSLSLIAGLAFLAKAIMVIIPDSKIPSMVVGSVPILVYAYIVRFLAVPTNVFLTDLDSRRPMFFWLTRISCKGNFLSFCSVSISVLFDTFVIAILLFSLDAFRELPLTLIVRPFNFDTIATRAYDLMLDERYDEASACAVYLVLVSAAVISLANLIMSQGNKDRYS